jgi:acetylornithine deacetylase/succinyl-diaminopimelate desuccinylase-like protein
LSTATLREEVTALLRDLVRLDTVNPPGNETRVAERLRAYLEAAQVPCALFARNPERANLVARLQGVGDGPSLCLLSHTDTVLADRGDWQVDPWGGVLHDDHVWGRGALDDKSQVAAAAVALASLAHEGFRPTGDLLLVAAADEEAGGGFGLRWLCEAHPEVVRCDYALNEGGGARLELAAGIAYLCGTAEKAVAPLHVRVRGRSGHAARPAEADNALVKAAKVVERLAALRFEPEPQHETEALLGFLDGEPVPAGLQPAFQSTVAPTMLQGSAKRNVIPGACEVVAECRLLPGVQPSDLEPEIHAALGRVGYELEWEPVVGGTRSPVDTILWDALTAFVDAIEADAVLMPVIGSGFTDSHWLRSTFGTVAYGFFPRRTIEPGLAARVVHGADERIPVDDLELGVRFYRDVARAVLS